MLNYIFYYVYVILFMLILQGKLTAFKIFVDNNFDEDSKILDEPKSAFDNIDIEVVINKADASMDMYDMPKEFALSYERIKDKLPGESNNIKLNPQT